MSTQYNLDASESIFFERQVESVMTKTFDVKHPSLKARELIPFDDSDGEGCRSIVYYQYDGTGIARIVNGYANTISRVDVKGLQFTSPVRVFEDGYGYNYWEIKEAAKANLNLEQRRANTARRVMLELENRVAFNGDAETGLPGFLTNANIPSAAVVADGTGSATEWSTKTPELIVRDVGDLINDIKSVTLGVEAANTVLLPLTSYTYVNSTPYGSAMPGKTILGFLKEAYPEITKWDWLNELETAGTSSSKRMVAYNRSPDALVLKVPAEFRQLPVQVKGLEYEVPCTQKCGGTIVFYPLSANFMDGI